MGGFARVTAPATARQLFVARFAPLTRGLDLSNATQEGDQPERDSTDESKVNSYGVLSHDEGKVPRARSRP